MLAIRVYSLEFAAKFQALLFRMSCNVVRSRRVRQSRAGFNP
jgi:hypothetical protein